MPPDDLLHGQGYHNRFTEPQGIFRRHVRDMRYEGPGGSTRIYGELSIPPSRELLNTHYPEGYKYDDLLPYLRKVQNHYCNYLSEETSNITDIDCDIYHGDSGPMSIGPPSMGKISRVIHDFVEKGIEVGIPFTSDYMNPDKREGIHYLQFFRKSENTSDINAPKKRESTLSGYLNSEVRERTNLHLKFGYYVDKFIYNGVNVIGVTFIDSNGNKGYAMAKDQVILSAGVIESPKLLQRNGIGSAALLNKLNIPVVVDNPHVGAHLKNHITLSMSFLLNEIPVIEPPYTTFDNIVMFLKSNPSLDRPDLEIQVLDGIAADNFDISICGIPLQFLSHSNINGSFPFISFLITYLMSPIEGTITIRSKNLLDEVAIDFG
jgi:choline dehydrogenase-like flavoprotein